MTPDDDAVPVGTQCLDLVSLETMYAYNPNIGVAPDYRPAGGSLAETAVAQAGVACGWLQQSSAEIVEIAAARPGSATLARIRAGAAAGLPSSSASGAEQFFSTTGGVGTLQSFGAGRWVVVSAAGFTSAADAQPLADSALAALG